MEFMEVFLILLTTLLAVGTAWFAIRYQHKAAAAADMSTSTDEAEADRAPETYRFADLFQERRFSIIFLIAIALLSGVVGHFIYANTTHYVDFAKILLVYVTGVAAMIIDLKYHRIPNFLPITLVIVRLITIGYEFIFRKDVALSQLISSALGLVIIFLVLFALSKAMRNGLGFGDVKFLSAVGFMGGILAVCSVLLAGLIISCLVSVGLLVTKTKKVKDSIPFAPFIYIGIVATILIGSF